MEETCKNEIADTNRDKMQQSNREEKEGGIGANKVAAKMLAKAAPSREGVRLSNAR